MLVPLEYSDIVQQKLLVREEFETLFAQRNLVTKRNAKQWRFFRAILDHLLDSTSMRDSLSQVQKRQYAHEVNQRLNEYYGVFKGDPVGYRFRVMEHHHAQAKGYICQEYPSLGGYSVVIYAYDSRRRTAEERDRDAVQRTLMEALFDVWQVYARLPDLDLEPLGRRLHRDSNVYRYISTMASHCAQMGWTISNPGNPSNMRILDVHVTRFEPDRAEVRTKEYWLLDWWSTTEQQYVFTRRERNAQFYVFRKREQTWVIESHRGSPPKLSHYRVRKPANREA